MSFTTNTRLGPYEILALLGAGGMSEVYRARDTRLDRDVAIKVLAGAATGDPRRLDRLLREARAISRLSHPHICALYDVGQHDGVTFLVMELLEGKTLAETLVKDAPPVERVIAIGLEIADALDAAHTRGVIHRDLKPGNIMITRDGIKLLDFGLAKLHEIDGSQAGPDSTLGICQTEEGAVLGTYPYMSPEQLQGRKADARSDLFALGVVLYEMATGSRPFQADNRAALTAAILTQDPPPVSTVSAAPRLLDRVIARCLEKNPEARWQHARDLASALRWVLDGEKNHSRQARPGTIRRSPRWRRTGLAASLAVALVGAGYFGSAERTVPAALPSERTMLAILPFVNNSGNPEQDYLSDGMTDEVIAQLGTLQPSRLGVIARTSAMHYKGTTKRVNEIASELGARYLLEGSFRRNGDRVRITAQLIDGRDESQVWAEQYDRGTRDILLLHREVATAIVAQLSRSLGAGSIALTTTSAARHSLNPGAYEHYLRGRYQLTKNSLDGMWKALEHFRKATDLDPAYALAHSGLGQTYALLGAEDVMPITESHPLARAAVLKALELDDTLADAHIWLANIIGDYYWDWAQVGRHFARALELAPDDAEVLRNYSSYLGWMGQPDEALPLAERAASLDPVSPLVQLNVGVILDFAGRFDEAVKRLEQAIELDPNFSLAHAMLGRSYLGKRMPERALVHTEQARALAGARPLIVASHAHVLARNGRTQEALKALDDLSALAKPRGPRPFFVALVYAGLRDKDRAFEWLDKAVEARNSEVLILRLKGDPTFAELHSDPRLPPLLARLHLPARGLSR